MRRVFGLAAPQSQCFLSFKFIVLCCGAMDEKGFVRAKREADARIGSRCIPGVMGVSPAAQGRRGIGTVPG